MNYNEYLNQIIGLQVLNVASLLNLTGFVFGVCTQDEQILENSYGLQLACPWVISCKEDGKIWAASGDFFQNPKDLRKIKGNVSEWQTNYTYLDENLDWILQKELYVEKINITKYGDLKVYFSNQVTLCAFTDFSIEQCKWWFYKCGGAYLAPLQNNTFVESVVTSADVWWLLKCSGSNLYLFNEKISQKENIQLNPERIDEKKVSLESVPFWSKLVGGTLIEIGRKKEKMLKEAPVSWLKIRIANEEKEEKIIVIYFYCPWRICDKKRSKIITATSDIQCVLCWDDKLTPTLRENDYYEEKNQIIRFMDLRITKSCISENGSVNLEFGEEYCFQSFVSHSGDVICWRGYCLTEQEYYEGGKGFLECHPKKQSNNIKCDLDEVNEYLKNIVGKELISIARKGTYYALTFSSKETCTTTERQRDSIQLICAEQWRIRNLKTKQVVVGGGDCRFPSTVYEGVDKINWVETINTKFEEHCSRLIDETLLVTDIKTDMYGDLQIFFSDVMIFEYFVHSSYALEEWQIRGNTGTQIKAFGNMIELVKESDNYFPSWMDMIKIPENESTVLNESHDDVRNQGVRDKNKLSFLIGGIWSPDMLNELNLPWRLYDLNTQKILLGTGDFDFPSPETEWIDFYEKRSGKSFFETQWEGMHEMNLMVQSVRYFPDGDMYVSLTDKIAWKMFNNLGD